MQLKIIIFHNGIEHLIIRRGKVTKTEEAKIVDTISRMGAESLSPDDYEDLQRVLKRLCLTRSIDSKELKDG